MALTPWRRPWDSGFLAVKDEIDKLFDDFFARPVFETVEEDFLPAVEVQETKNDVIVVVDVRSVDPKRISISVEGAKLVIRGESEKREETKGKTFYRSEGLHGAFQRVVQLPAPTSADKATAASKDGVLTITIPKIQKKVSGNENSDRIIIYVAL